MITRQQEEYLVLYTSGMTMTQIAKKYSVNKSTVSRVIKRATAHKCPFSPNCQKCPLPECAINEEYAYLVNSSEDKRAMDKRRTVNRFF